MLKTYINTNIVQNWQTIILKSLLPSEPQILANSTTEN